MQSSIITVIFSHGKNSSPWYGFKIEKLRPVVLKMGINLISISYPENLSIEEMEDKLYNTVKDNVNVPGDLVFLSSSRGAYISTRIVQRVIDFYKNEPARNNGKKDSEILPRRNVLGQFLIAPAFYIDPDYYSDQNIQLPENLKTSIIHGLDDDVISFENSIKFAKQFKTELYLIRGNHRLTYNGDKLCVLFESFLKECQAESNKIFEKWCIENK